MNTAVSATAPPAAPAAANGSLALATMTLWRREMVRFFRQRNRVIGAFATPVVFWLLLGSGLNRAFAVPVAGEAAESIGYLAYFFPGALVLILLFTAIFSTISVIEDRNAGFLQGVLVSPAPRLAIVLGKVFGGASIATLQGILFLLVWPIVGGWPGLGAMLLAVVVMFVLAVGLTALGLCIAWPLDSTAGFHAIMNLFLMPMWFLSGAVFPVVTAPLWLQVVMYANPLTYGLSVMAAVLQGVESPAIAPLPMGVNVAVMLVSCAALVGLATWIVGRTKRNGV
ncbi:ABC transporter permease [Phycisphaerales bacterium AB-hyl4]|uniref:Transport permease protein n=1 Tax=Natronomicrosphaera hydrolytica TaxID=3242702 RepID=A0ABV4U8J8_9BACT